MESISAEKKLELLRQIREEQNVNQAKLQNRTSLLYGNANGYNTISATESEEPFAIKSTLKFRLILSIILVVSVVTIDYFDKCFFGYTAKDIDYLIEQELIDTEELYEQFSFKP